MDRVPAKYYPRKVGVAYYLVADKCMDWVPAKDWGLLVTTPLVADTPVHKLGTCKKSRWGSLELTAIFYHCYRNQ